MTKLGRQLIAAAKGSVALARLHGQQAVEKNWDMGQARTCLNCEDIFLTKKDLRIHRAKHTEIKCVKTATT